MAHFPHPQDSLLRCASVPAPHPTPTPSHSHFLMALAQAVNVFGNLGRGR